VEIRTAKKFPRLFQVAKLARQDLYDSGLVNRRFPRQRDVTVGIALEKGECLDNDGNGSVKP
jgi:hypothetical protein